eukprot:8853564-Alexandrium_andersonii.AAC.1
MRPRSPVDFDGCPWCWVDVPPAEALSAPIQPGSGRDCPGVDVPGAAADGAAAVVRRPGLYEQRGGALGP